MQGKIYSTETDTGLHLLKAVQDRLHFQYYKDSSANEEIANSYNEQTIKRRLGQGAFRIMVTDAYHRKCSITGEKTLPVLDAAHIKPYAEDGPHLIQNGLLMRTDIHALFDKGYITIDAKYNVEVSKRLNEDFGNGKIYYEFHGKKLQNVPDRLTDLPSKDYLKWHNDYIYLG